METRQRFIERSLFEGDRKGSKRDAVLDTDRFSEDYGFDSLDYVELVMSVECEFGIYIPDEDAENLKTVGEMVKYIDGKLE